MREVLHIAGQSREQFESYLRDITVDGRGCPRPVGAAAYLSLSRLLEPLSVGPDNTQDVPWLLTVPGVKLLHLALFLQAPDLQKLTCGQLDERIESLAAELASTERRVLLRVGYEFDGPHNAFDPTDFRPAFAAVASRVRATATNVEFVWHSYAWEPTYGGHDLISWYPGDEHVDWVGMTVFSLAGGERPRDRLLEIADHHEKRVLLSECSPVRVGTMADAVSHEVWEMWFEPFFDLIEQNESIGGFSIIECNWDISMPHLGYGDARIAADPILVSRWRQRMLDTRMGWVHAR